MILTPYGQIPGSFPSEITRSYGPGPAYLCAHDPYQHQRGEAGFYHDTPLGQSVPTDMELRKTYGYTPYNWGWVYGRTPSGQQAYWPSPWTPRDGWTPGPRAPMAFGPAPLQGPAEDIAAELNAHNRRTFQLAVISTIAVTASALLAIFRTGGLIRADAARRG